MRTLTLSLIVPVLSIVTSLAQQSSTAQPYDNADAYQIYSLLLPHEESYGFAEDALMIQENTVAQDISEACLTPADANRFKSAIAGYNRAYKRKWLLQRQFQIAKPYRIVGAKVISALTDHPVEFASFEYQQSKQVVAGEEIREQIAKIGIRRLERDASVSHHTLARILKCDPVRRKTLAKIVKQFHLHQEDSKSTHL